MEKRVLLAVVLSVLVLIAYPFIFPSVMPPPPDQKAKPPVQESGEKEGPPLKDTVSVPAPPDEMAREEKTISIETDLYRAVFSNRGGVIRHWELKKYWADQGHEHNIVLFDPGEVVVGSFPLEISVYDSGLNKSIQGGFFNIEGEDLHLSSENPRGSLSFTFIDPDTGKGFRKALTFYNESYKVDVEVTPLNFDGQYTVSTGSNFGIAEWGEESIMGFAGPTTLVGTKLLKDKIAKIEGPVYHDGDIKWAAIQDKYFISAIVPKNQVQRVIVKKTGEKDVHAAIEVNEGRKTSFMLYAGPKEYDRLKAFQVGLDESISFGWFIVWELSVISWMAKGLFYLLELFYKLSHNYGIAIIFLTAVVRIVFIPLTYKSFKSMKDIQKVQPEIQKLQKKYKDNRAEMNKAMMELYKTHKVNPLGGCLPMLLQLPVFIGLYNLLANMIELRQTPFFLWIQDLSVKDPYYVLPIIMGISMLVQQKMTPSTVDPMQAKIMLIMPVMFTFFFLNFPSGLVLYWLVNNVLTIGQQYVTTKYVYKS